MKESESGTAAPDVSIAPGLEANVIPRTKTKSLVSLPVLFVCIVLPAQALAEGSAIPKDFKIVAQYGAGFSPWKSWRVTIWGHGQVSQEIYSFGKDSVIRSRNLSQNEVQDLLARVKEAAFFEIPKEFFYDVTDAPTLAIIVTMEKKTHKVIVYAPSYLRGKDGVKRFLKVWAEVLRKVPPPNPEQKPDLYGP